MLKTHILKSSNALKKAQKKHQKSTKKLKKPPKCLKKAQKTLKKKRTQRPRLRRYRESRDVHEPVAGLANVELFAHPDGIGIDILDNTLENLRKNTGK
jgi:hypothetical protein